MSTPKSLEGYEALYHMMFTNLSETPLSAGNFAQEFRYRFATEKEAISARLRIYAFIRTYDSINTKLLAHWEKRQNAEAIKLVQQKLEKLSYVRQTFGFYIEGNELVARDKNLKYAALTDMLINQIAETHAKKVAEHKTPAEIEAQTQRMLSDAASRKEEALFARYLHGEASTSIATPSLPTNPDLMPMSPDDDPYGAPSDVLSSEQTPK